MFGKVFENLIVIIKIIAILCLVIMAFSMTMNVFYRYFLSSSLTWVAQTSRYLMLWAAFLTMPVLVYRDEHLKMDFLLQRFSFKLRLLVLSFNELVAFAFFLAITVLGINLVLKTGNQQASSIPVQMNFVYSVIPVSGFLMGLCSINKLLSLFNRTRTEIHDHDDRTDE